MKRNDGDIKKRGNDLHTPLLTNNTDSYSELNRTEFLKINDSDVRFRPRKNIHVKCSNVDLTAMIYCMTHTHI